MSGEPVSEMSPTELANTPCSKPPEGIQYNLKNPHSDGPVLIVAGACLLALMLLTAGFRFYIKIYVRRKFTPDDWTALIATVGTCAYYGLCVYGVVVQKFATHMWDLSIAHCMSETFIETGFHSAWIPAIVWGFAKTTFFLMYLDLFTPLLWLRWACYIGIILNWAFYIGKLISSIYLMAPNIGQSWQESTQNPRYSATFNMIIPIATGSLILDIYILILPMIVLWNLRVTRSKKLGLAAIFGVGFLACVASTLSVVFNSKLKHHVDDYTYWTYPTLLMALLEMCTGITCSSMPALAGFLKSTRSQSLPTWVIRIFTIRSQYGDGSDDKSGGQESSGLSPTSIRANTYINIEVDSSSTHELVSMHAPFVSNT